MTGEDFANARPARDALPPQLYDRLVAHQKSTAKPSIKADSVAVTLRLDRTVVDHFKAGGVGWQKRINAALTKVAVT